VLVEQIYANLADDGPRLVLADQLLLAGDPRGELIAVQCELARHGYAQKAASWDWIGDALADPEIDPAHIKALRACETALLAEHRSGWVAAAREGYPTAPETYFRFERGFVAHVDVIAAVPEVASLLAAIGTAIPTLEALTLSTLSLEAPERAFAWRAIGALRALAMPGFGARGLVTLPHAKLRELVLHGGQAEAARPLFEWKPFGALRVVELNGMKLDARDAARLVAAAGTLDELQLRQSKLGSAGAATIATSERARGLKVLSLLANGIGPAGTKAVVEHLPALRALDLRKNAIGVAGAEALGRNGSELRTLDLTGNTLGAAGVAALVAGDGLGALRELCLQQTMLDDAAVQALAASPLLARLRVLSLRSNKITDVGAGALANSPYTCNLVQLNLNNNKITAAGKRRLDTSPHLEHARIALRITA
nr:TIGR02996 domain-containing protein [Deltaproteobacteria bacterium]